jgi:hypothetical protein
MLVNRCRNVRDSYSRDGIFLKAAAKRRSTLPTIIAWGQAGFSAKELCEVAGVCVTHIKRNIHNTPLRFAKQLFIRKINVTARR